MSSSKAFVGARIFDGATWHDGEVLVIGNGEVATLSSGALRMLRLSRPRDCSSPRASSTFRSMAAAG